MNIQNLYEENWHFGCHENELSIEGSYIKFKYFDQDIVLYNDGKEIIAFDNICPHRGARFFLDSNGIEIASCKYHGWTQSQGKLIIPNQENFINCPNSLNKYNVEYCGSFIFFSVKPKHSLRDQLSEFLYSLVEEISFDCQNYHGLNRYIYDCNWAISVENALEPDHVNYVHKNTLAKLNLDNCTNEFYKENSIVKFSLGNERIIKGLENIEKYLDTGNNKHSGYMSIHLYPFSFISSTNGCSYSVQNFMPISENETDFISRLYYPNILNSKYLKVINTFIDSTSDINREVFEEDHQICKRITYRDWVNGLKGPLSNAEIKIKLFRENLVK